MKTKSLLCAIFCYLLWAFHTLYWNFYPQFDASFLLAVRILLAALFTFLFVCISGKLPMLRAAFREKHSRSFLFPAAAFLGMDWGIYIWAVTSGHVLDSNIGYYLNPLFIFLFGLLIFHEKANKWEIAAVMISCIGVICFTAITGQFPLLSLLCALVFPLYAMMQKFAHVDAVVSIAAEALIMSPFALIYLLFLCPENGGIAEVSWRTAPFLLGAGFITAFPMILYDEMVNDLPMKLLGIMQYSCTTLCMLFGVVFLHETLNLPKLLLLIFILCGVIVFSIGNFKKNRAQNTERNK